MVQENEEKNSEMKSQVVYTLAEYSTTYQKSIYTMRIKAT